MTKGFRDGKCLKTFFLQSLMLELIVEFMLEFSWEKLVENISEKKMIEEENFL